MNIFKTTQIAFILCILCSSLAISQVGIGNPNPDTSSVLDVTSTTQGMLMPRMTTAQRNAIVLPANGLIIFNTGTNVFQYNSNTPASPVWNSLNTTGQSLKYSNSNTTTDVNQTAAIDLPIFGNLIWNDNPTLYTVTGNQITVAQAGRYLIHLNVSLNALNNATIRVAPDMRILVNGNAVGTFGSTGYIRRADGHNDSSIHITEALQLNANDVITISTIQAAGTFNVTMRSAGSSNFYIEKKS